MKTKILTVNLLFCAQLLCHAQCPYPSIEIRTPNGTIICGIIEEDHASEQSRHDDLENQLGDILEFVEILEYPIHSYNCAAYAFVVAEGGPICQLGPYYQQQYLADGSYIETNKNDPEAVIIHYNPSSIDEHFAIKAPGHPGKYISKWSDKGPLVLHDSAQHDYYHVGIPLKYYKKNPNVHLIAGDHFVCDGGSNFTYNNYFVGSKVWDIVATGTSTPSNAYFSISGSNTGSTVTVYKTGNGNADLRLRVDNIERGRVALKPCVGTMSIFGYDGNPICTELFRSYMLRDNTGRSFPAASWEISPSTGFEIENSYASKHYIKVRVTSAKSQQATLIAKGVTGNILATKTITACPSITGASVVCNPGYEFKLNAPAGTSLSSITWEVGAPFAVTPATGNPVTVTKTGAINSDCDLIAKINGKEIARKNIIPCQTSIQSPSCIISSIITVVNPPQEEVWANGVWWGVTGPFIVSGSGNTVIVSIDSLLFSVYGKSGTLTLGSNAGGIIDSKTITECSNVRYYHNEHVTSNTTVPSSGIHNGTIYVKNVTVSNGAKLTFKTTGSVIFGASFVVEPGSDFEI